MLLARSRLALRTWSIKPPGEKVRRLDVDLTSRYTDHYAIDTRDGF